MAYEDWKYYPDPGAWEREADLWYEPDENPEEEPEETDPPETEYGHGDETWNILDEPESVAPYDPYIGEPDFTEDPFR